MLLCVWERTRVCVEKIRGKGRGMSEGTHGREREIFAAGDGVEAKPHIPEHDEDVRDVVHATVVNVV